MQSQAAKLRCFIVEDSPVILRNVADTLEHMLPIQVVSTAGDEAGATDWLRSHPGGCDLMIVDVFLKSGIGLNVLVGARRHASQARKIVLTNHASDAIRRRCLSLGADRVFDKSHELDLLLDYCGELTASPALP